jgi:hypothetical protein
VQLKLKNMNTRQTSIDAYRNLVEGGVLAEKNRVVYKHLFHSGATTQKKTERFFNDRTYTLRPRFAQLEKMGLIECVGEEVCEETGKRNMLWDVTNRVHPIEIQPALDSKKDRVKNALDALRQLYRIKHTATDDDWKNVADLISCI